MDLKETVRSILLSIKCSIRSNNSNLFLDMIFLGMFAHMQDHGTNISVWLVISLIPSIEIAPKIALSRLYLPLSTFSSVLSIHFRIAVPRISSFVQQFHRIIYPAQILHSNILLLQSDLKFKSSIINPEGGAKGKFPFGSLQSSTLSFSFSDEGRNGHSVPPFSKNNFTIIAFAGIFL